MANGEKKTALNTSNLNLVHRHPDFENGLFLNNSLDFCANKIMKWSGDEFVGKSYCCVWVPSSHTRGTISNPGAIFNWHPRTKERLIFSSAVSLCIVAMYEGRPQAQPQMVNTHPTQWYFCVLYVSYCFVWAIFVFLVFWYTMIFNLYMCVYYTCSLLLFFLYFVLLDFCFCICFSNRDQRKSMELNWWGDGREDLGRLGKGKPW